MNFRKFLLEDEKYKYTGAEKHLFDFQPKFKEGDKVIPPKNVLYCESNPPEKIYNDKYAEIAMVYKKEGKNVYTLYPIEPNHYYLYKRLRGNSNDMSRTNIDVEFTEDELKPYKVNESYEYTGAEKNLFDFLEKPKFKVGDKVKSSYYNTMGKKLTIIKIEHSSQHFKVLRKYDEKNPWWIYIVKSENDKRPTEKLLEDKEYRKDNAYAEINLEKVNINEKEYKWTGYEQHLFDRPKFKIGQKVTNIHKNFIQQKLEIIEPIKSTEYEKIIHYHYKQEPFWLYKCYIANTDETKYVSEEFLKKGWNEF